MSSSEAAWSMAPHDRNAVLVVEDEPVLRAWMVRGLSKIDGIDVIGIGTVRDARRSINTAPPDLVITDLDLPDGSGIEVVGELDRVGLRIPIVFVSAFVGQYQSRLPKRAGTDVFEKPISLDRLRRIVDERLKEENGISSSPFGVADYIQLAGLGRRSVVIEVRGHVAGRGEVIIRGGEVWSARDEQGAGEAAFRRLAFLKDAVVTCRPCAPNDDSPRSIMGSCEGMLLDAARFMDESDAMRIDGGWEGAPEPIGPRLSTRPPVAPAPAPSPSFAQLYEEGVDALLAKRFNDAYRAFANADALSPGDSRVHANLERLRQMGHSR